MPGLVALCCAYVFSQFSRSFLSVLAPRLTDDLGMSTGALAYASGAWFVAFALFQFPVGILLDSVGPRRTAGFIFTLFAGAGAFLFALAPSGWAIIVAMGLMGIGCSPALMAPFYIFAREWKPAQLATLTSVFIAIGTLGNVAGSEPLAAAVDAFGWRNAAFAFGGCTLVIGLAVLFLVKDPKRVVASDGSRGSYGDLLRLRVLWPIFPIVLMGYAVAAGLRGLWIGTYFDEVQGFDTLEVGRATLYMAVALVTGTLMYGPLDRIFRTRKWVVFAGNLIVLIACMAFVLVDKPSALLANFLFVLIGIFGASYAVQMAHGRSYLPDHLTGRGATLLNFCSIGGAGFFQWMSGLVVNQARVPGNPEAAYQALFMFYSVLLGITLLIYLFSIDAKPKRSYQ